MKLEPFLIGHHAFLLELATAPRYGTPIVSAIEGRFKRVTVPRKGPPNGGD